MIYFDNGATTLQKPKEVAKEVFRGISAERFGNPGRGAHASAHNALAELFKTRSAVAKIFNIKNPLNIALCQNATAALNLVIKSLFSSTDGIITTKLEHNSVLRPLYQLEEGGAELSFIGFNTETGKLFYNDMEAAVTPRTKAVIVNHCSNVTGSICDLDYVYSVCKKYNLIMLVDASQSAGTIPIDISKYENSIFCFTGHKGLYGPQGTGGIAVNGDFNFKPVFSGGSGVHSFEHKHPEEMPDIFEAGTMNVPAFMGLTAGCNYILKTGIEKINVKLKNLRQEFIKAVNGIPHIKIYGTTEAEAGSSIGINLGNIPSGEVSRILDEEYSIATRPGAHCAPLVHTSFGTEKQGIVRFSFSSFNTKEEIKKAAAALERIAANYGN